MPSSIDERNPPLGLIGVPFDGMGRNPGQAGAPAALRAAGLAAAFAPRTVVSRPDVVVPDPRAERSPDSRLLNGGALLTMLRGLGEELRRSLEEGQFPLIYGADCSVLLAAIPALRSSAGDAGLVFFDGHEDATLMEQSSSGEAANMEIAVLLGETGKGFPPPLDNAFGALSPRALAMLGPRDEPWRRELNMESVAGRVWLRHAGQVSEDPRRVTREAVQHVSAAAANWWLHVDLDVLHEQDFFARGAPGELALEGGLTWGQLTEAVQAALGAGGCRGLSLVIYNPDLDPDRRLARRIVEFAREIIR
jgi:arginase